MSKNGEIQLLPEKRTKIELGGSRGRERLFTTGVVLLVIVLALGGVLLYLKTKLEQDIARIDSELIALESKRDKAFEKEVLITKKQLGLVAGLLDNHVHWTGILTKIEDLLQGKVKITSLKLQKAGYEVDLGGVASGYSTLAKQIAAFLTEATIKDVALQGAQTDPSGVIKFDLRLTIDPKGLSKNE